MALSQLSVAMKILYDPQTRTSRRWFFDNCNGELSDWPDENLDDHVDEVCRSFNLAFVLVEGTDAEGILTREWGRHAADIWNRLKSYVKARRTDHAQPELWSGLEKMATRWNQNIQR